MRHDHSHHAANDGAHDRHAGHSVAMFRDRFWIALALTVPTMLWSEMIQHWFGYRAPVFPGSSYLPALFGSAVYCYGGWPFLQGAVRELRNHHARHDDADRARDQRRLRLQSRRDAGGAEHRPVVGTGDAGDDHAPGPLDRDAVDRSGARRARGARRLAARQSGSAQGRWRERECAGNGAQRGRSAADPARCRHSGRRHRVRGPEYGQRIDDHRRVAASRARTTP